MAISQTDPEVASLRVSEVVFQNTFVIIDRIIDRYHLYMEFNVYKDGSNQAFTPFVIIIEDPYSEVLGDFPQLGDQGTFYPHTKVDHAIIASLVL